MVGQRDDDKIVPLSDGLMFILIIGNNLVRKWVADLVLGHIKLFLQNHFENKIPFFLNSFLQKSFQNYFKLLFFHFFISLPLIKYWTIKWWDDHTVAPSVLKIVGFKVHIVWVKMNNNNKMAILELFLAIFPPTVHLSFTKPRFKRSFWAD